MRRPSRRVYRSTSISGRIELRAWRKVDTRRPGASGRGAARPRGSPRMPPGAAMAPTGRHAHGPLDRRARGARSLRGDGEFFGLLGPTSPQDATHRHPHDARAASSCRRPRLRRRRLRVRCRSASASASVPASADPIAARRRAREPDLFSAYLRAFPAARCGPRLASSRASGSTKSRARARRRLSGGPAPAAHDRAAALVHDRAVIFLDEPPWARIPGAPRACGNPARGLQREWPHDRPCDHTWKRPQRLCARVRHRRREAGCSALRGSRRAQESGARGTHARRAHALTVGGPGARRRRAPVAACSNVGSRRGDPPRYHLRRRGRGASSSALAGLGAPVQQAASCPTQPETLCARSRGGSS